MPDGAWNTQVKCKRGFIQYINWLAGKLNSTLRTAAMELLQHARHSGARGLVPEPLYGAGADIAIPGAGYWMAGLMLTGCQPERVARRCLVSTGSTMAMRRNRSATGYGFDAMVT